MVGTPHQPGSGLCLGGFGRKPQAGSEVALPSVRLQGAGGLASRLVLPIKRVSATWTPGSVGDMPVAFYTRRWEEDSKTGEMAWPGAIREVSFSLDVTAILSTKSLRAHCARIRAPRTSPGQKGEALEESDDRGLHSTAAFCPCRTPKHPPLPTHCPLLP